MTTTRDKPKEKARDQVSIATLLDVQGADLPRDQEVETEVSKAEVAGLYIHN